MGVHEVAISGVGVIMHEHFPLTKSRKKNTSLYCLYYGVVHWVWFCYFIIKKHMSVFPMCFQGGHFWGNITYCFSSECYAFFASDLNLVLFRSRCAYCSLLAYYGHRWASNGMRYNSSAFLPFYGFNLIPSCSGIQETGLTWTFRLLSHAPASDALVSCTQSLDSSGTHVDQMTRDENTKWRRTCQLHVGLTKRSSGSLTCLLRLRVQFPVSPTIDSTQFEGSIVFKHNNHLL